MNEQKIADAAPDMLAALKALIEHVGQGQYVSRSNLAAAIEAVAKAEG